jgi:phosphoribosylformylglycinamidine cyclo-ligase
LSKACSAANCSLIGGETAQMPGLYRGEDYDLVGTIVGIVDRAKLIDGSTIKPGDVLLGLSSSGLHTNGYSLARKIIFQQLKLKIDDVVHPLKKSVGHELLQVHRSYLGEIKKLRAKLPVKGLAHITGGGLIDNLPRILPNKVDAVFELGSWPIPPIFQLLKATAKLPNDELYQVFNMGIGMVIVVAAEHAAEAQKITKAHRIGRIVAGNKSVQLHEK